MAWRIAHNVVRGEIDNRVRGRVEGRIWLAGRSDPVILRLSGNCHIDLAGCRLEFSNPKPMADSSITLTSDQNGVVGDITAVRKVRVIDTCDFETMEAGTKSPERLANALYLEWFTEINGRVVIESADYQIRVSERAWKMSQEEETQQCETNAAAMQSFLDRVTGTPDAREEAAYNGEPKDEFEWELFLRASDRRVTKLSEVMEKYHDSPDCERLIARAMGWVEIEEMLDAEPDPEIEEELVVTDDTAESEVFEQENDTTRHPLVTHILERSITLMKLVGDRHDPDLEEMVAGFIAVGPKVAGALGSRTRDRCEESAFNGLTVAKLKRAMGELSRALNAASRLNERDVDLPVSIGEWTAEMLKIREEFLLLMNEFRSRPRQK
jgi:hypothetical protein